MIGTIVLLYVPGVSLNDRCRKLSDCFFIHTDPKTIVIFGATGQQGGSIVKAMKDDKRFVVKAATRNAESDSAKKLAAQGIGYFPNQSY